MCALYVHIHTRTHTHTKKTISYVLFSTHLKHCESVMHGKRKVVAIHETHYNNFISDITYTHISLFSILYTIYIKNNCDHGRIIETKGGGGKATIENVKEKQFSLTHRKYNPNASKMLFSAEPTRIISHYPTFISAFGMRVNWQQQQKTEAHYTTFHRNYYILRRRDRDTQ